MKKLEIQIPRSAVHVWMGYRTRGDPRRPRQIRCLALQSNSPLVTTHHVAGNGEEADQSACKWKRMKGSNAETQCEVYEQHTTTEEGEQIWHPYKCFISLSTHTWPRMNPTYSSRSLPQSTKCWNTAKLQNSKHFQETVLPGEKEVRSFNKAADQVVGDWPRKTVQAIDHSGVLLEILWNCKVRINKKPNKCTGIAYALIYYDKNTYKMSFNLDHRGKCYKYPSPTETKCTTPEVI